VPAGATITSYNSDSTQITVDFGTTSGDVSVNENNIFGSTTSSLFVAVGNSPAQQTLTGPSNVSSNTSATYSITTPSGVTNHWSVPAGATITSANTDSSQVTISFGTSGGTVSVTQSNSFGSTVDSETISVGNPPVTQTISGPIYIATGSTGVTYSVPDNSGSTYHWTLPAGATITSANADSSLITASFGNSVQNGTILVNETNPYGSATSYLTVSAGNAPVAQTITGATSVNANQTATYSVPDNAGSHYTWSISAGATITYSNGDSSQIAVNFDATGGPVSVTETNPYGSATSSSDVTVTAITAITAAARPASYQVYPNPFSATTNLIVNDMVQQSMNLTITDVNGVVLYTSSDYSTNQNIALGDNISASGIYFVQVTYGIQIRVIKLVKI